MLIYGILMIVGGLFLALWLRKRAELFDARIAEGDDAFFEEQRSYQVYPWLLDPKSLRVIGIIGRSVG